MCWEGDPIGYQDITPPHILNLQEEIGKYLGGRLQEGPTTLPSNMPVTTPTNQGLVNALNSASRRGGYGGYTPGGYITMGQSTAPSATGRYDRTTSGTSGGPTTPGGGPTIPTTGPTVTPSGGGGGQVIPMNRENGGGMIPGGGMVAPMNMGGGGGGMTPFMPPSQAPSQAMPTQNPTQSAMMPGTQAPPQMSRGQASAPSQATQGTIPTWLLAYMTQRQTGSRG